MFEYVKNAYGVPACIGRRVKVEGRPGTIVADKGNYLGVNFDSDPPHSIKNIHPTWEVEYLEIAQPRKVTRSQKRYQRFLEYSDCFNFESFLDYCRWDAEPERPWNGGNVK